MRYIFTLVALLGLVAIFLHFFTEPDTTEAFYTYNDADRTVEINAEEITHVKLNLYEYDGLVHWTGPFMVHKIAKSGQIVAIPVGLFLLKTIKGAFVDDIIDVETYEMIRSGHLYRDKSNIYFVDIERACHLCIRVLSENSSDFRVIDARFEYGADDATVYCLRSGEPLPISLDARIERVGDRWRLTDGDKSYEMCELVDS